MSRWRPVRRDEVKSESGHSMLMSSVLLVLRYYFVVLLATLASLRWSVAWHGMVVKWGGDPIRSQYIGKTLSEWQEGA